MHKYLYAADDPVNHIDPSGHDPIGSFSVSDDFVVNLIGLYLNLASLGAPVGDLLGPTKTATVDAVITYGFEGGNEEVQKDLNTSRRGLSYRPSRSKHAQRRSVLPSGKFFWDRLLGLANRRADMHADEYKSHPPTPTFMLSPRMDRHSTRRRLAP